MSPELAEGVAGLVCPFPEGCGGTDKHEATYLPEAFIEIADARPTTQASLTLALAGPAAGRYGVTGL
ncbi:hypothetical protein [Fulvitalea axinellae]